MITLFIGDKNLSSWSMRAWLVAEMSGVSYREEVIHLDRPETKSLIAAKSPSGRVPALVEGELVIWDSLAIAEYLAERVPGLWPKDPKVRAVARAVSAEMHSGFAALRQNMPMNITKSAPGEGRAPGVEQDIARICDIWRDCRARFGRKGQFLFGDACIADAFFAPVVTRFGTYGVGVDQLCESYRHTILTWAPMTRWIEGARAEG
jgi:glutathione S-transferase